MKKTETREQKIERYMKLSKKDLAIMLVDAQWVVNSMFKNKKSTIYVSGKRD